MFVRGIKPQMILFSSLIPMTFIPLTSSVGQELQIENWLLVILVMVLVGA